MKNRFPEKLFYSKDYSWVKVDGNDAWLGIIDESAKQVEEFIFIMLPEVGKVLKKDDVYVSLEAVKWSGQLTTPLAGEVVEVNQALFDNPSQINQNPYDCWIAKIKLSNKDEIEELMSAAEAQKFYQEKFQ